jgi:hypothetical protein
MLLRLSNLITVISFAGSACFLSGASMAADADSEAQWFVKLAKANNGKAFCAPPTTTMKELLDAFSQFVKKHPELNGRVNDEQTLRALAEHYPCATDTPSALGHTNAINASQAVESTGQAGNSLIAITPIFSQLLSTSFPKDFQPAPVYEVTLPGQRYMRESVLKGETVKEWTQMITVTGTKDLASSPNLTPQKFVESMAAGYRKACADSFSAVGVPVGKIDDFETFSAIVSCGSSPLTAGRTSESAIILAIKGEHDYYTIQWAERAAPSSAPIAIDSAKWTARFNSLVPIKLCPIVPGESAPYQSCIDRK